jgi:hypothetical protein
MLVRRFAILISLLFFTSAWSLGQRLDAAFTAGQSFVSDTTVIFSVQCFAPGPCPPPAFRDHLQTSHHYYVEGTLGVRLLDAKAFSLHLEVPAAAIPSQNLTLPSTLTFSNTMTSIFVTPSLKLKAFPSFPVAPWLSAGGGWAHYSVDPDITTNKGALQFGGGVDIKIGKRRWGFRGEIRDFITGAPNLGLVNGPFLGATQGGLNRQNILAGGGVTFHF